MRSYTLQELTEDQVLRLMGPKGDGEQGWNIAIKSNVGTVFASIRLFTPDAVYVELEESMIHQIDIKLNFQRVTPVDLDGHFLACVARPDIPEIYGDEDMEAIDACEAADRSIRP